MFSHIKNDIDVVFKRDPAARSRIEVILSYPGLHALWGHRFSRWLWLHGFKILGRWSSQLTRAFTGIEIHPGAIIGEGFFIDHGMGVVIGETSEIGNNVTLYHGVTLGGVSLEKGKRHPTLEDDVVVGAGAKILGAITVGAGSRIGANSVVVKSVPPDSVVVGVPGRVVVQHHPDHHESDFHHDQMPDTIGLTLVDVLHRLETLEKKEKVRGLENATTIRPLKGNGHKQKTRTPEVIHLHGLDFMI